MKLVAAVLVVCACGPRPSSPRVAPPPELRFEIGAVDPHADPCTDFYAFACGGWRATHPIPADRTRWSRYNELAAENLERERSIVEAAARADAGAPIAERRVGAYHAACMDERAIEAHGLTPIRDVLARIAAIRTRRDASEVLGELHAHGIDGLFTGYPDADLHDTRQLALTIDRGALGLPDVAAYTKSDGASAQLRAHYRDHLERLFRALDGTAPKLEADRTLAFETSLAQQALSAVDSRHRDEQDHPMTAAELGARYPAIDWPAYFARLGAPAIDRVNVAQPAWLDAVNSALATPDSAATRDYLRAVVVRESATMLPAAIERDVWDFDQRELRGAREMPPRWKRCLTLIDRDVGDDVGRIFVARYFSAAARARMATMIAALLASYHAAIAASDWLGPDARAAADAKLSKLLVVIGASNRPRSFDGLRIERDDAFGNAWRAQAFEVARQLADLGRPTDREKFFDALPQGLDGFGAMAMNAVGFTAGFLQPPVFDPRMDDAVNFGGLGSVIGHELTHHFDDDGRKFDGDGNLRTWWAPDDVARYVERAQCFVDEYDGFHLDDGTPLDGKLTLGENIADNGGIRLSYAALAPSETGPELDGFTPAQRFFLAWGQIRCENVTPETAQLQARTDGHSAGHWRVDGVVSNMPEFARAFSCSAGAPMAPVKRCKVW